MYIVIDGTLPMGQQMAQIAHGVVEFSLRYPELTWQWSTESNYVCVLQAKDEAQLHDLEEEALALGIKRAWFLEPDYRPTEWLTCVVFEPGEKTKQLLKDLKLAGK